MNETSEGLSRGEPPLFCQRQGQRGPCGSWMRRLRNTGFKANSRSYGSSSKIKNRIVADEWVNKTWCVHAMGYYAALKRMDVLTQAATWMNLEDLCCMKSCHERTNTV